MSRINKFVADLSGLSRRAADNLIAEGRIAVNGRTVKPGYVVKASDLVTSTDPGFKFDHLGRDKSAKTVLLVNKPEGYVCSRKGQGSKTVYDLLPSEYHHLKPAGRLDKDSSGLLLMTNNGELANKLAHPRYQKEKTYRLRLNKPLALKDKNQLLKGVKLEDDVSKFIKANNCSNGEIEVVLAEGRNRQIRRTFNRLGYGVTRLHRTKLGDYSLNGIGPGQYKTA